MGTETCNPKRPVSVIHFHGTDDQFAPFKGGKGKKSLSQTNFYSVEHSIRSWAEANSCKEKPETTKLPDKAKDGTKVTITNYGSGKDKAEVVLVAIKGMGHTWPGQQPTVRFLGKSTRNVSANEMMWEFFQMRCGEINGKWLHGCRCLPWLHRYAALVKFFACYLFPLGSCHESDHGARWTSDRRDCCFFAGRR